MERLNWFNILALILLLMILGVLWMIKEVLDDQKETDATRIRNSRRFRQFITKDYFFRKSQRKINQEIIKDLQTTYGEYENTKELRDELLGIKAYIKDEMDDFSFILTAIFSLILSLIFELSEKPSAVLLIPSLLIVAGMASYLTAFFEKTKMERTGRMTILYLLPLILTISTILILAIQLATGSSDGFITDWLFKATVIEAAALYLIQLYEKVKYVSYLETVSIVLNEMILEEDRKLWIE